jgi:hypothetical protein
MSDVRRLIIVRRGESRLFEQLQRRYRAEPTTVVLYDRRAIAGQVVEPAMPPPPPRPHRRFPMTNDILDTRGYFVVRVRPGTSRR